jgi:hypothetical protein
MTAMRRTRLALALSLVVLGGASSASATVPNGCHSDWPVTAHRAGGIGVQVPAGDTPPLACAVRTGYATSESTLAVSKRSALIYSPANTENSMARSTDKGAHWHLTYPYDAQPTSFWNTVDPFVIADRRTGRIFWSHATGPVRNEDDLPDNAGFWLAAAYGFEVYRSSDAGRSWLTADYETDPTGDWEQVFTGPAPAGSAQPIGYPDIVYLCANAPFEVTGPGRACYKSLDGGGSFQLTGYASPTAANPQDICPPLQFRNGVVDSHGTIYIPATCDQAAYILTSHDEGASWSWAKFTDAAGDFLQNQELQIAIDDADNLYALYPKSGVIELEVSRDLGKTWSKPMEVAAPGVQGIVRPALSAGAAGNVAITYYGTTDPKATKLSAYITQTKDAVDAQPLFYSAAINDTAKPIYTDGGLEGPSPRTDFVGGSFDMPGTSYWAGVVEQTGPPDSDNVQPTVGYVGRLIFSSSTPTALP